MDKILSLLLDYHLCINGKITPLQALNVQTKLSPLEEKMPCNLSLHTK